jgi:hypothetical protein
MRERSLASSVRWFWLAFLLMTLLLASCPGGGSGGGY